MNLSITDAQMPMPMLMMMGRGGMGGISKLFNNPYTLCKMTESVKAVPCRMSNMLCQMQSIKQYKMPNLMKCSPLGVGCCIKDAKSLMFAKMLNWDTNSK